jgi:hypothetical protein
MLKFGMGYLYIYKIKSRYSKVKNFRTSKLSHTLQVVLMMVEVVSAQMMSEVEEVAQSIENRSGGEG